MIKTGQIELDGTLYKFSYERDNGTDGIKYRITDLTTSVVIWRDEENNWQQQAEGNAPLSQETLTKIIDEILNNP